MPRRNLRGGWGENRPFSVRLALEERWALETLRERWDCSNGEAIRRALREAAARTEAAHHSTKSGSR